MAVVYKHFEKGTMLAVKSLKQQILKRKLKRVGMKLANLSHKNIVKFVGICLQPSAFIYELCEVVVDDEIITNVSQLLEIYNEESSFVFKKRMALITQATEGVEYLHSNDIIHRDFKPSNMLICGSVENICVKLADFDDMYLIKNTVVTTQTRSNDICGMTLSYVAEELVNGTGMVATKSSDIFSWALSSYEILSNFTCPWSGVLPLMSDGLLIKAFSEGVRPSLKCLYDLYEENLEMVIDLIKSSWATSPSQRPSCQQVGEFLSILFSLQMFNGSSHSRFWFSLN